MAEALLANTESHSSRDEQPRFGSNADEQLDAFSGV